jgi:putative Mn2+ efflux pump MntP
VSIAAFVKVVFVAASLGLDVFAVSVGVGMRGMTTAQKIRIGLAFTTAEVSMTVIGVGIGNVAGRLIGDVAGYLGFAALVAVGSYMVIETLRESEAGGFDLSQGWGCCSVRFRSVSIRSGSVSRSTTSACRWPSR